MVVSRYEETEIGSLHLTKNPLFVGTPSSSLADSSLLLPDSYKTVSEVNSETVSKGLLVQYVA